MQDVFWRANAILDSTKGSTGETGREVGGGRGRGNTIVTVPKSILVVIFLAGSLIKRERGRSISARSGEAGTPAHIHDFFYYRATYRERSSEGN